jgi:asparagine synthase (glutamine-hydrolysing)
MCGIVGILNLENQDPISEDLLTRMISVIRHRGPDETGHLCGNSHVGLGHARLSIIGLEGGASPSPTRTAPSGSLTTARSSTTSS